MGGLTMRLEYFEYLIEINNYKNMRIASEQLHMTPQALSICVKNMEQEVGFPIFIRRPKGVELTPEGERLLECAERILNDYHNTLNEIREEQVEAYKQQNMIIYITPIMSVCIGKDLVEVLKKKYPFISAHIINDVPEDILTRIQEGCDEHIVGIVTTSEDGKSLERILSEKLDFQLGFSEELVLAAEKHSVLARQKSISLDKLKGKTLLHCTSQKLEVTPSDEVFSKIKDDMHHIHCNSIGLWGKMICDGVGFGPIFKRALQQAFSDGILDKTRIASVAIDGKPSLRAAAVYCKDTPEFVKKIIEEIFGS